MKSGFKLTVLLALMAGLLSVSIGWHFFGRAGNKPVPENPSRVMHSNGQTIVVMGADEQKNDGIELQKVKPFDHRITRSAYAVVLDILPILDMRGRYSVACAQLKTDESAEEASRQEFLRLKVLYRDHGNVSLKVLQTAQLYGVATMPDSMQTRQRSATLCSTFVRNGGKPSRTGSGDLPLPSLKK